MKLLGTIFVLFLSCTQLCMGAKYPAVLDSVFAIADKQTAKQWHYRSDYYYKGSLDLKRKNFTSHFIDNSEYYAKGGKTLFSESCGVLEHAYKLHFDYNVNYRYDAALGTNTALDFNVEMFSVSLYERYILRNRLLSPLNRDNAKYYKYRVKGDSAEFVRISFRPRINNSQMVQGVFLYDRKNEYVSEIIYKGDDGLLAFVSHLYMGNEGQKRYWPVKQELEFRYSYYGNLFTGKSTFCQKYIEIDPDFDLPVSQYGKYDMTYLYSMIQDTTLAKHDSIQVAKRRQVPLTEEEQQIYDMCYAKFRHQARVPKVKVPLDSLPEEERRKRVHKRFVNALGDAGGVFFHDFNFNLSPTTSLSINTIRFNYSGWRGYTIKEDAEIIFSRPNGKQYAIKPLVGYNFKPRMFVGHLRLEYDYLPKHLGQFSINFGTRGLRTNVNHLTGQKHAADVASEVFFLFRENYVELQHTVELFNGFNLMVGLVYKNRGWEKNYDDYVQFFELKQHYISLAHRITATYTPGQYFYFKNNRKIVVGSKYPTIILDYERAKSNLLHSTNHYEKWEALVRQNLPLNPFNQLMWTIGGGMYNNHEKVCFLDYRYFNMGNTDYSWQDEWAGVFQLLDNRYYYDSKHYLRAHLVLQSPTIVLGRFGTKFIRAERIYANSLLTEGLAPYIEMGYGVSTVLLDVGVFASYIKKQPLNTGIKFSIHLQ